MQASILACADQALKDSEQRTAAGLAQMEESAAAAQLQAHEQCAKGRVETSSKVDALRAESEDLLQRLGLQKKSARGAQPPPAQTANLWSRPMRSRRALALEGIVLARPWPIRYSSSRASQP